MKTIRRNSIGIFLLAALAISINACNEKCDDKTKN